MQQTQLMANWKARFFGIWSGQAFSLLGSSVAQFGLVWWLTTLTGSATVLATASLVAMLPQVLMGPFAGALIDRWQRRWVMVVADGVAALMAAWLAYLFWSGAIAVWHVYVVMFVRSIAGSFHWPAMQASTSLMVPEEQLSRVAGLNQTLYGAMNIVAPPLGAMALAAMPLYGVMGIDVVTAIIAIGPLLFVGVPQPARAAAVASAPASSLGSDIAQGFRYVWHWRGLTLLLAASTLLNFFIVPAFSLLSLLVYKEFGGSALQLGSVNSAWGVGMLVGGLALSGWGGFKRKIVTSMTGAIGMGLGVLVVGLAPAGHLWLVVAGMGLVGLLQPFANGPIMALMQATVSPEMQGRVFTLVGSASAAMSPLSLAIAGPVADAIGVQSWYLVGAVATIAIAIMGFTVPDIMHIEERAAAYAARYAASSAPPPSGEQAADAAS
jgi:MFS transporter, DHA3 family, macrolide efflux protein